MCRLLKEIALPLLILTLGLSSGRAEDLVSTGSLADIYARMTSAMTDAQSIEFTSVHHAAETEIAPKAKHRPENSPPQALDVDMHFVGRAGKYFYTETYTEKPSGNVRSNDLAWDGKYYQVLSHRDDYLFISERDPDHNHLRMGCYSPLNMFGFMMGQMPAGNLTVGWENLKNIQTWKNCLGNAQLLGAVTFHGRQCSAITIRNQVYRELQVPRCTYTVYFSWNEGMFPLAWTLADENGRVLKDYEIVEFGQIPLGTRTFYYPKKAKGNWYPEKDFPPGKPEVSYTSEITGFSLNSIMDDDIFTIDPSKAAQVYDRDKNVGIVVPK